VKGKNKPRMTDKLKDIKWLKWSARTLNCLDSVGIVFFGDLCSLYEVEIKRIPNLGRKSLNEIRENLNDAGGFYMGGDKDWSPKRTNVILDKIDEVNRRTRHKKN
jgi:DNA-directed RNA polymerase alpha subunit